MDKNKTKDKLIEELKELRLQVAELNDLRDKLERMQKMMREAIVRAHDEKEKSEAVIKALGDGISIQDPHFKVLYQNDQHKKFVGGDHRGEYCYAAYQRKDRVCDGCHLALSFRDGKIHKKEQSRATDNGTYYYEIISSPLRNSKGEMVAGIEAVRDITDRKRMEHAVMESELRYRTIFETAGDAIYILDAEGDNAGRITAANRAACEMHGYTQEELLSMNIQELNTPETAKHTPWLLKRIIEGETLKTEVQHYRKDGSIITVEVTGVLMNIQGHKYVLGMNRDVTERKNSEIEKELLISKLRTALDGIKQLKGLLPICSWCKKVRNDKGYWMQVEKYVEENTEATFTHGICPECLTQVRKQEDL